MNVHAALDRFMRAADFLEGKRVVEELRETLLGEEGLAYLQKQLESVEPDTPLAQVLGMKAHMLIDCRRMSIGYAFAWMFLELHPEPVSAELAKAIAAAKSTEAIAALARRDPPTLAAVQHVVVATQLQNDLQAELGGAVYPHGSDRRVEACRVLARLCDRRIDAESSAMIAGELANAISASAQSAEAIDECIRLYESVLADTPATRVDMIASAHHSLGMMHTHRIGTPGDNGEAVDHARGHFAQALLHRTREQSPERWAQTQHALGRALLAAAAGDGARARDVLGPLSSALEVYAERGGPWPAWLDAQQALEMAYLTIAREDDSGTAERLEPAFEGWPLILANRDELPGYDIEQWLSVGESLGLWEELLTLERHGAASDMPFAGWLMARRQDVAGRLTDGHLQWEILKESDSDVVYRWSVTGDYAIEDQYCLARVIRGGRDLHSVRFVARRVLERDKRIVWLDRLASLAPRRIETSPAPISRFLSAAEVQDRIKSLAALMGDSICDAQAFRKACVDGVSRSHMPDLYVSVLILCAARLMVAGDPAIEPLSVAIETLRRAVETATARSETWARAVVVLAKAYLLRAAREDAPDPGRARLAFKKAAEVFSELGLVGEVGAIEFGMGNCERLAAKTPADLNGVLRWYIRAIDHQPMASDPLGWAETTAAIGEVCAEIFRLTRAGAAREQAEAAYERALAAFASNPLFSQFGTLGVVEVMARVIAGLQSLDRAELPVPVYPAGFRERETRGNLLFLRPLMTARALSLDNLFTHPERFAVRFEPEPPRLTLETALYRALAEHLGFWSIAGHSDGTGASRLFVIGGEGWKNLALLQFDRADVILFVPSDSPGVRWEIETLRSKMLMGKVLFLMPPHAPDYDVEGQWIGARRLLSGQAIEAPAWDPKGLFFAVNAAGQVDWTLPFDTLWDNSLYAGIAGRFALAL